MSKLHFSLKRPTARGTVSTEWDGNGERLLRTAGLALLFSSGAAAANARFSQNDLQRAKVCEGGLQQVETDEGREPEPVGTVIMRQQKADEDECSCESANDHFHIEFFPEFS